jgi:Phosphate-selective porin O and P
VKAQFVGALLVGTLLASMTHVARAQAPTVTVGGVAYAQFGYQLKDSTNHVNNFDITRAYINVTGKFAYGISTRVTADIYRVTDGSGAGSLNYRLKYAYVAWNPEKSALTYKIGQMHTPFIDWEEALWDYRVQGTMALERGGYMSSSDFGIGVDGNWSYDKVNMQIGLYNGENYNKSPGDQRKDLMGRVSVRLLGTDEGGRTGGLRLTGYGQVGKPTGGGTRQRYIGMLSYRSKALTLAAEFASTKDSVPPAAPPATATPEKPGKVISLFGVYRIPNSKVALLARFDSTDPSSNVADDRLSRVIAGVSYRISDNLRVMLDLDNLSYQSARVVTPAEEAVRSQLFFQAQINF